MEDGKILIDLGDPSTFECIGDDELQALVELAIGEQKSRALEAGDINALIEEGFEKGFSSVGVAKEPWMRNGLLVCMGSRIDKSGTSHICSFANVGQEWVWESVDKIHDTVRNIPGPKASMRSVTIIAAHEGMEVDLISSKTRGGMHERVSIKSYTIKNGDLVVVDVRAKKTQNHR